MATKELKTDSYESGQNSGAKGFPKQNVLLKSNVSKKRNAGQPDALTQAIAGRDGYIPSGMHPFSHSKTPKPRGAVYSPEGEFGRPTGTLKSKATNPMGGSGGKGTFRGRP